MRNDFLIDTESACVVSDEVAVKIANCTRLHQPSSVERGAGFAAKKVGTDSLAKTQKLLDRAIALAWKAVKSNRRPPALTPTRWVWRLAGAYHSSCHTSRLMEEAAQRFAVSGRKNLAQWAVQKAREEAGHDRLALRDIQSMGYDAEAVVQALVPSPIKALVDYFIQSVQTTDPIACVGFFYGCERLGTFIGKEYIQSVEALLPLGTHATRWLRVHSSVGAEVKHVEETVRIVAELTLQERVHVARACYETALLRFTPPKEGYISDEELQNVLKPLELNTCLRV
jgi:pyrroloquinoline quinone (PQQ) biosynthesis protein C